MSARAWILVLLVLGLAGWWRSPHGPGGHAPRPPPSPDAAATCQRPPGGAAHAAPLQSQVPTHLRPVRLEAATLTPLAGFRVEARVLSRRDYRSGREAELSPTDLALGWGRMREDAVLAGLDISQSGRWYHYRWSDAPPIPPEEIVRSSANMHFIPANADAARELARVREGDHVRVEGWLVEAVAPDGWTWRSSLTREDSGDGACELVYVCSLQRL